MYKIVGIRLYKLLHLMKIFVIFSFGREFKEKIIKVREKSKECEKKESKMKADKEKM